MVPQFNLNNALYIIEAIFFGVLIFYQRRQWKKRKKAEPEGKYGFDNAAPFDIQFAMDSRLQAVSYDEIVPNLRMGFPTDHDSKIYLSQRASGPADGSPPGRPLVLEITLEDVRHCDWLTLERTTEFLDPAARYDFKISIRARCSRTTTLSTEICVPRIGHEDLRIPAGDIALTTEFQLFTLSSQLNGEMLKDADGTRPSRVIVFLPPVTGNRIEMTGFDVNVDRQ